MTSNLHHPMASKVVAISGPKSSSAEETLRLIARLPAPSGLEDRVHAALRSAPRFGEDRARSKALNPESGWMRTAAAAAIVFVVGGGGWGVYTHVQSVQQGQPANVIAMPHGLRPGGFSGAGAMRTPQTLPGPSVILPVRQHPAPAKGTKKPAAQHPAPTKDGSAQAAPTAVPAAQPAAAK